ncbi:FAD-dependent oxidoreductase [Nocardia sp. NBC_01377]|uniref:FAD-dependent oxidoreductase n=1 Tax=Nocardia sp. NBC_01377 TaxID=2903595 RepID=UPI003247C8D9
MTHVILGHCCKDASCVRVCPQNCIHPAPGEVGFDTAETLFIDPRSCIDCTACVEACPASAIKPARDLTLLEQRDARRNEAFFLGRTIMSGVPASRDTDRKALGGPGGRLSIAVVGSGPAALYSVREILQRSSSVRVTVFEKFGETGGLLRRGVSRHHPRVREMDRLYDVPFKDDRVSVVYETEVGVDVSIEDLRRDFDAVILACGASEPRSFGPADPELSGRFYQAIDILSSDNRGLPVPIRPEGLGPRCLVVGAGNVALDIVRYIAERGSADPVDDAVTDVVILARSNRVAFTPAAFDEIADLDNVDLAIDRAGTPVDIFGSGRFLRDVPGLVSVDLSDPDDIAAKPGQVRVTFSFGNEVVDIRHSDRGAARIVTASGRVFESSSVIGAAGFRMKEMDGVFIDENGVVLNRGGRVISPRTGDAVEGLYVTGWAKRGSTGGIGDNRVCAEETVAQLAMDLARMSPDALFER